MGAGSQFESTKASAAVVHFPGAQRDAAEKIFISPEHEKSGFGKDSPGEQQGNLQHPTCAPCPLLVPSQDHVLQSNSSSSDTPAPSCTILRTSCLGILKTHEQSKRKGSV